MGNLGWNKEIQTELIWQFNITAYSQNCPKEANQKFYMVKDSSNSLTEERQSVLFWHSRWAAALTGFTVFTHPAVKKHHFNISKFNPILCMLLLYKSTVCDTIQITRYTVKLYQSDKVMRRKYDENMQNENLGCVSLSALGEFVLKHLYRKWRTKLLTEMFSWCIYITSWVGRDRIWTHNLWPVYIGLIILETMLQCKNRSNQLALPKHLHYLSVLTFHF